MKINTPKIDKDDPALRKVKAASQKVLNYKMTVYLPKALAHRFKVRLAKQEKKLSEVFTKLAEEYMKRPE